MSKDLIDRAMKEYGASCTQDGIRRVVAFAFEEASRVCEAQHDEDMKGAAAAVYEREKLANRAHRAKTLARHLESKAHEIRTSISRNEPQQDGLDYERWWMIERDGAFYGRTHSGMLGWTADRLRGMRFGSKADADLVMVALGIFAMSTQHAFAKEA